MSSASLLLLSGAFNSSCSQPDKKEISAESDQACRNFQTFVSDAEAQAPDYEQETAQLKADFDAKVAAADKYADPR